jgi:hypothetical protein
MAAGGKFPVRCFALYENFGEFGKKIEGKLRADGDVRQKLTRIIPVFTLISGNRAGVGDEFAADCNHRQMT